MSKQTTRPNATISNDFTLDGAASAHAALSDNSDATDISIESTDPDRTVRLGFAEPTIPAGAVVKQDVISLRLASSTPAGLRLTSVEAFPDGSTSIGKRTNLDVTWTNITTITALSKANDVDHDQLELVIKAHAFTPPLIGVTQGLIHEAYWQTVYVEQPTVDSVSVTPSSPISDDDTPRITWTETLDADGGDQAFYQVRTFTDAVYGAGGFDAATSVAVDASGLVGGTALGYTIASRLDDDTYRSYVRVGQVVNGEVLWSDWEFVQFVLAVDRPAMPTINSISADSDNARIEIHLGITGGGAVSSDAFQIERSTDGGTTWEVLRTVSGLGLVTPGDTAYDYEVANSQAVRYQVRSFHTFPSGTTSSSDWVESSAVFWASEATWIKHPTRPDLNLASEIYSQASRGRTARQTLVDVLGRDNPVPVSDVRRSSEGPITFMVEPEDLDAFEDLIETNSPVLVQAPPNYLWPDRWVSLGDLESDRYVDKLVVEEGLKAFTWTEVDAPSGDLVAWE